MRKNLTLLIILLSATVFSYAQPEKGDRMMAGNISAAYSDNITAGTRTDAQGGIRVQPLWGFVLNKGFVVGFGLQYRNYFDTDYNAAGDKTIRGITHAVGPMFFVRRYTKLVEKFYLRSGIETGYVVNMYRTRTFPSNIRSERFYSHSIDFRLRLGVVYFPHPNVGLEFSYGELGYQIDFSNVRNRDLTSVSNRVGFKYGVDGIEVGISYFMRKKEKAKE